MAEIQLAHSDPSENSSFFGSSPLFDMIANRNAKDEPEICKTVRNVIENKISANKLLPGDKRRQLTGKPGGIIVFFMGGISATESTALQELNKESNRYNIIAGGSQMLSISSYVELLQREIVIADVSLMGKLKNNGNELL